MYFFYKVKLFLVDPSVQNSVLGCYSVIINHLKVLLLDPAYSHMQQFIISSCLHWAKHMLFAIGIWAMVKSPLLLVTIYVVLAWLNLISPVCLSKFVDPLYLLNSILSYECRNLLWNVNYVINAISLGQLLRFMIACEFCMDA